MEQDAQEQTLRETIESVDNEITNEDKVASSTTEESPVTEEEKELEGDDDYSSLKKGIDDDLGSQKNIHPRFREVYKKMKDAERSKSELQAQLDELSNKPEAPPELNEQQLLKLAQERGYQLTKAEQKKVTKLNELLNNAQPQEREWLNNYASAIKGELLEELKGKYDEPIGNFKEVANDYRLDRSLTRAKDLISSINKQHGLDLDYEKDIDKEVLNIIRENKNLNKYNTDMYQLTQMVLAKKGIELGKRLSQKEQRELNEKKKSVQTESSGTNTASKVDDSKASLKDIWKDARRQEGLA